MNKALRLAIAFAAVTLAWNLYGFAANFFEHFWGGRGQPVVLASYLANALLLAAIALIAIAPATAARALVFAGVAMALWSAVGVAVELAIGAGALARGAGVPPLNLPEPPPLMGPLVPMITGALTAILAWSGLRRLPREAGVS